MKKGLQLIVFSAYTWLPGEAQAVNAMLSIDSTIRFHLRKPQGTISELAHFLGEMSEQSLSQTVLHSMDTAKLLSLELVLKSAPEQRQADAYRHLLKYRSFSAHSTDDILNNEGFDYYFLSPIFDSISKEGYMSNFRYDTLTMFLHQHPQLAVIALGGISADKIEQCREMGFAGIAVLGDVWNAFSSNGIPAMMTKINALIKAAK